MERQQVYKCIDVKKNKYINGRISMPHAGWNKMQEVKSYRDVFPFDFTFYDVRIGSSKHVERHSLSGSSGRSAPLIIN